MPQAIPKQLVSVQTNLPKWTQKCTQKPEPSTSATAKGLRRRELSQVLNPAIWSKTSPVVKMRCSRYDIASRFESFSESRSEKIVNMAKKKAAAKKTAKKATTKKAATKKKAAAKKSTKAAAAKDDDAEVEAAPKKKKRKTRAKKAAEVIRRKLFWGVFNHAMKRVALYEFNQRKAAEKRAKELSPEGKPPHFVQKVKEDIIEEKEKKLTAKQLKELAAAEGTTTTKKKKATKKKTKK
jgi:hypothetical protein